MGQDRLLLVSAYGRLDWHLQPSQSEPSAPRRGLLMLATSDPTLALLSRALKVSIPRQRQVYRLALGATLIHPVSHLANGLALLSGYLPRLELETHGDRDFIYRINRRRTSSSARHVEINRIAAWSLEEVISGSIQLTPYQAPQVSTTPYLCVKLVMDINTVPGGNAFPVDRIPSLFAECKKFAHEIAVKGDVP